MEDQDRLDSLTPGERRVYEVHRQHPDWSKAQIGRAAYLPPHVVRRYLANIETKLQGTFSGIELEVLALVEQGLTHAEIADRLGTGEKMVRFILYRIDIKKGTAEPGRDHED